MTNYGNGYYTIIARSGREYLVSYAGHNLNSCVYPPQTWSKPYQSLGLSHSIGAGTSLGGGSTRCVDLKARHVIRRTERQITRDCRRQARTAAFLAKQGAETEREAAR